MALVLIDHAFAESGVVPSKKAPAFTLRDVQGNVVKSSDFSGKSVILSFVVTWDEPSQKQIEILSKLRSENSETNLVILAAAIEQPDRQTTKAYVEQAHPNFPFVVADYETISGFGGLAVVPTTFVIDKDRNVIQRHEGVTEKRAFESELKLVPKQ